jgi:hypothetical protein
MVFGILIGTGIFYLIFADGKVQKWNNPKEQHNNLNYTETNNSQKTDEFIVKNS